MVGQNNHTGLFQEVLNKSWREISGVEGRERRSGVVEDTCRRGKGPHGSRRKWKHGNGHGSSGKQEKH